MPKGDMMKVYVRAQFVVREDVEITIEARDLQEARNIWRMYEQRDGRNCESLQMIPDWKYDAVLRLKRAEREHREAERVIFELEHQVEAERYRE